MKDDDAKITTQLETSGNSFEWLIEKKADYEHLSFQEPNPTTAFIFDVVQHP